MSMKMESPTTPSSSSQGPQLRSRITVVCGECKRLKLKCDRRNPCGSCVKRDTIQRCVYSAQAAEKIDVQSIHIRVCNLETKVDQIAANGGGFNFNVPTTPFNDRTTIAIGQSGSSVVISLDDVVGIWLDTLDLAGDERIVLRPAPSPLSRPAVTPFFSFDFNLFRLNDGSGGYGVTPALVHQLPRSPTMRDQLTEILEYVMEMHPSIHFGHFRRRMREVFAWADTCAPGGIASGMGSIAEDGEDGGSRSTPRVSLSFFSSMAAGLALAARILHHPQTTVLGPLHPQHGPASSSSPSGSRTSASTPTTGKPTSPGIPTPPPPSAAAAAPPMGSLMPDHHFIFMLSTHAWNFHENSEPYDLDTIIGMIFQCLYYLHDGSMALAQPLITLKGKLVAIAQHMGLCFDPEDGAPVGTPSPHYGPFETEQRRRTWWEVYYLDLFISDCMGHSALIQDGDPTCRYPSDVNEDLFDPLSTALPPPVEGAKNFTYFGLKCRLAQLVKNMKKRTFRSPTQPLNGDPGHSSSDLSIDSAIMFESEIAGWLAEIPPQFQLNMLSENMAEITEGVSPILTVQRCEIAIISSRLVVRIFVPFLKRRSSPQAAVPANPSRPPPHHAVHACVNAAHKILHASRVLHSLFRSRGNTVPNTLSESLFYSFARQVFDAGVIAAHSVISQPASVFAKVALEDLKTALEILRDPIVSTGRGPMRGGVEGAPSEALQIMELLKTRAEEARSGVAAPAAQAGMKRKFSEVSDDGIRPGFQLPYIGGSVVTAPSPASTAPPPAALPVGTAPPISSSSVPTPRQRSSDGQTKRDNSRRGGYPAVGVRNRHGGARSRAASLSSSTTQKGLGISHHAAAPGQSHHPAPMPPPSDPLSGPYSAGGSQPPSGVPSDADFGSITTSPTAYRSSDDHIHYHGPPQTPSEYSHHPHHDAPSGYPGTPVTAGTSASGYFASPQGSRSYGPPPAPGYEAGMGPHAHTHVPMPLMGHPQPPHGAPQPLYIASHTPMDTSGGNTMHDSVPSTPHEATYGDKVRLPLSHPSHTFKTDEDQVEPMGSLGYPPPNSSPMGPGPQWQEAQTHYPQNQPPAQPPQPPPNNWGDGFAYWKGQGN